MGLEDTETESLLNKSSSSLDDNNNEESVDVTQEKGHSVGTKSLNTFYSFVFIINQIYGPGVLAIPVVFQEAGWIPTTIVLAIFLIVSCFSSTLLCEALSLIPGNKKFDKHIEYTGAVKHYFGHKGYIICQVLMNLCMQVYNIASIVVCAQSLDQFMLYVCGKTWAIELIPHPHFLTVTNLDVLYSSSAICISLGYLVITVFCLPAGFLNLEDNVKVVQLGSFVVLVVLMVEFCGQFFTMKLHLDQVPAVGTDYSQLVSIFIFSWAYVMFVPSWVNEKKDDVSTNKVIWSCGAASFVGYMAIGLLAALVVPTSGSDDLLKNLGTKAYPVITIIASYIFSLGVIAPGIPVCCITTRYNLYIGKVCGKKWSYFWGVIAPWLIGFIFSQKQYYNAFVNWSSLIINGVVNFLIPLLLYYKAISVSPQVLSDPSSSINSAEEGHQQYNNNQQINSYKNSYKNINKEESTQYIASLTMAPSTVEPWPLFMKKNAKRWTIVFFIITTVLVAAQIVVTTYETIEGEIKQHHNHTALNMTHH